jgi:hypothetical protein
MISQFDSRIAGIPCIVGINWYSPGDDGHYGGRPEFDDPGYGSTSGWVILDRRGRRAEWLERKMTDKDVEKIERQVDEHMVEVIAENKRVARAGGEP